MKYSYVFLITVVYAIYHSGARLEYQTSLDILNGKCECGFFANNKQPQFSEPLVTKFIMNSPCPADKSCKKICEILGSRFKSIGSSLVCATGKQIERALISTYYRVCDDFWYYTGISNRDPICCKNYVILECESISSFLIDSSEPLKIIIQQDEK